MTPYIDSAGASWAAELFGATNAASKILVIRRASQLGSCGTQGDRLRRSASHVFDYEIAAASSTGAPTVETFHAKVVLADGAAAYVGSEDFLYRSREANLKCGFLMEGDAVAPVSVLVDALIEVFTK